MSTQRRFGWKHGIYLLLAMGFVTAMAQPLKNKLAGPAITGENVSAEAVIDDTDKKREQESANAFRQAYRVFMHPRCMNCHPAGDAPLQGDDSRIHAQNVTRGRDGKGLYAMKCANCHQAANVPGENMPPGNPNWHLPPANMKMIFQGRSVAQLARQFKDPKQTGKTLKQLLDHVEHDQLVLGCWNPGDGRTKPPMSHEEFAKHFREWVEKGAVIPQ